MARRKKQKFLTRINIGHGDDVEMVEAKNYDEAEALAEARWREDVEMNADYEVLEYNEDNCENYNLAYKL